MLAKKSLLVLMCLALLAVVVAAGCAQGPSQDAYKGGAVGGGVGAAAGALLDSKNRWRGGVIGGALGAVLGGALGEISNRAANEAAAKNQPVYYRNESGTQRIEAHPSASKGNCQVVTEKYYEKGQLVKVTEREVCP